MKKILIPLLALLLFPLIAGAKVSVDERLNHGAIIKDVTIAEDSIWAYVNVEAVIDATPARVWNFICDMQSWPKWLPMNENVHFMSDEAELLITPDLAKDKDAVAKIDEKLPRLKNEKIPKGQWHRIVIEEYDLIWPLKNEWVVRRYDFDDSKIPLTAIWKNIANTSEHIDGSWKIEAWKNPNSTLLKYYYRVKVKAGVPTPVFKTAVSFTVNSMIKSLRREVKKQ